MAKPQSNPPRVPSLIRSTDLMTLRLFATIVEERQIGRAAEREGIAASAVTKRILDLEHQLGAKLFERGVHGTVPTPAGRIVDQHVRDILRSLDGLQGDLGGAAADVRGHLRVWCNVSSLVQDLAADIAQFLRRFPEVSVEVKEAESLALPKAVAAGRADLGIGVVSTEALDGVELIAYREDRLVAAMTHAHPLSARRSVTFAELLDTDLVGGPRLTSVGRQLDQAARAMGRTFRPKYRASTLEGARSLMRAGLGATVLPVALVWPFEDADHVVSVELEDPWASRRFGLFLNNRFPPARHLRALIDFLIDRERAGRPG